MQEKEEQLSADAPEKVEPEPAPASEKLEEVKSEVTEGTDVETTTVMSGMKKAVLDLYALSQGTQKMLGEEAVSSYSFSAEFFQPIFSNLVGREFASYRRCRSNNSRADNRRSHY